MPQKPKKVRVTLDLSQEANQRIEDLTALVDGNSKADTIRQALQVYEFLAQKVAFGYGFKMVSPDGTETQIVILGPIASEVA